MYEFHQAETPEDLERVHDLFIEYMRWVHSKLNEEFGIDFDVLDKVAQDMAELQKFHPQVVVSFWQLSIPRLLAWVASGRYARAWEK